MMTNQAFLEKVRESFTSFVLTGTSRSTAKLKPLHGAIAQDLAGRLGAGFTVKSQGYGDGREASIEGRYTYKKADIAVKHNDTQKCAGIAVKFVMQNYSQNSNNYFENMLGETANIRAANCPYFQILVIPDKLPYYKRTGELLKWEEFTDRNVTKYVRLSFDDTGRFRHTPDKTLICVVHIKPEADEDTVSSKKKYLEYYRIHSPVVEFSKREYPCLAAGGTVILNDYEEFACKVYHTIMAQ